jgi:radical SAM protein with 4Fe4S-binding SPASM domain
VKLLSTKHLRNRAKLIYNYLKHSATVNCPPAELSVEITNACNTKCLMCPRKDMKRAVGHMDFSTFKGIVDQSAGKVELIHLHLFGEPLMHPELVKFINYTHDAGIDATLSTNCLLLDEEKAIQILNSKLDYIILAVDGVTEDTYQRARGNGQFSKVVENVERFLKLKQKINPDLYVIMQMIYMDDNKSEAKTFIKQWEKPGVNSVRLKPCINFSGEVENYGGGKKITDPCFMLWRLMVIYWDGSVPACCTDCDGRYLLGSLKDSTIDQLWNGERMVNLRKLHARGELSKVPMCQSCIMPGPTIPMLIGGIFVDPFTSRKILAFLEKQRLLRGIKLLDW